LRRNQRKIMVNENDLVVPTETAYLSPHDASTWVPFSKLRFGSIFRTERGWRGIKAVDGSYSYDDGENFIFEDDTLCMPIPLGGWPPRNEVIDNLRAEQ
jgi:hypothetical protein